MAVANHRAIDGGWVTIRSSLVDLSRDASSVGVFGVDGRRQEITAGAKPLGRALAAPRRASDRGARVQRRAARAVPRRVEGGPRLCGRLGRKCVVRSDRPLRRRLHQRRSGPVHAIRASRGRRDADGDGDAPGLLATRRCPGTRQGDPGSRSPRGRAADEDPSAWTPEMAGPATTAAAARPCAGSTRGRTGATLEDS